MKSLGSLLRDSIESSGYTIYRAASKAGINRTTLQKVLSDDRFPSEELLSHLLPILKLSPAEEMVIRDQFEILQDGESIYLQRRYIKTMLESMSDVEFFSKTSSNTLKRLIVYESSLLSLDGRLIHGIHNVENLLNSLMTKECKMKNAKVCVNVPGNLPILDYFFIHNFGLCDKPDNLTIMHITNLVKAPELSSNPLVNLDILSRILSYTVFWDTRYKAFYYYSKELIADNLNIVFPFYIIFHDIVVLLSTDGTSALPVSDSCSIQYFYNLFSESMKQASSLMTDCLTPDGILEYLIAADKEQKPCYSLEFQPCLATYLTESMIHKIAHPCIKNQKRLIQAVIYRTQQLAQLKNRTCIFNQGGLLCFIQTGLMTDFPESYIKPMNISDRIIILESLYQACLDGKDTIRMVNPMTFSLSKNLICTLRNNCSLDFSRIDNSGKHLSYIHITEHTILDVFEDFFLFLLKSSMLYTANETLSEIRNGINYLKNLE